MPISDLNVLLSCHSLDDFPTYHTGEVAEGILAAWTALWHPALIAAVDKLPDWLKADDPPEQLVGRLIAVPQVVQEDMPGFFFSQAEQDGATLITGLNDRDQIVAAALEAIGADRADDQPPPSAAIDPHLAADFLALGFCYLQTEVLTRRMRYMSNLDEDAFGRAAVAAAKAAAQGNQEESRTQLTAAFNTLLESRGYFYPVDAYFLDITLVGPTTMGAALREELSLGVPMNVLLTAATLEQMAESEPTSLAAIKTALEAGTLSLIGGEFTEGELPLLPHEAILAQLQRAREVYDRLLGQRPKVFGRWRTGLTPVLPQILHDCGFIGAMHFTLDGAGQFPTSDRIKAAWAGLDGMSINAIAKLPLNASLPETFLALSETLGDTMDHDFVATAVFAHWPGRASPFYGDLRRAAKYAGVLGKFATVEQYFNETESAGTQAKFSPDQYRSPYLQQAVAAGASGPLSSGAEYWTRYSQRQATEAVALMTALLAGRPAELGEAGDELASDNMQLDEAARLAFQQQIEGALQNGVAAFAAAWQERGSPANATVHDGSTAVPGYLLVNPLSFTRRVGVELSELPSIPDVAGPVQAADETGGIKRAIVEVPALGFAWVTSGTSKPEPPKSRRAKPQTIAVERNVLRNEHCEVKIHPETGGIQAIRDFRTRGNRLSQQLAIRSSAPAGNSWRPSSEPIYTVMVGDSIEVQESSLILGRIASRGRLVDLTGKAVAQFVQTVSLWHGAKTIEIEIELLSLFSELAADPWNSYFAARFAWSSSTAELRRSVHGCSVSTQSRRLEAPQFVEIVDGSVRTAILTGGQIYHRRSSDRMLDSILKVRGETANRFRLNIGLDMPHAWRAAQEMFIPPTLVPVSRQVSPKLASARAETAPPLAGSLGETAPLAGWLFHIDAPNVTATHWSPLVETGQIVGFRVRLLETEARRGPVRVRCFRQPRSAERLDLAGKPHSELTIDDNAIVCEIGPYEWIQIEARW